MYCTNPTVFSVSVFLLFIVNANIIVYFLTLCNTDDNCTESMKMSFPKNAIYAYRKCQKNVGCIPEGNRKAIVQVSGLPLPAFYFDIYSCFDSLSLGTGLKHLLNIS